MMLRYRPLHEPARYPQAQGWHHRTSAGMCNSAGVGLASVTVADVGRKELDEALARPWACISYDGRHRERILRLKCRFF